MRASKTIRRIALTGLSVLGLLAAQVALAAGPAAAFTGYVPAGSFGAAGSGNGQFKEPAGVAVNDASKEVYVYDSGNLRVERFDSTGSKLEGQFNGAGSTSGPFAAPATISEHAAQGTLFNLAVDNDPASPSTGDVYVVDPGHNVIDKFTAAGVYLSQLSGFKGPVFGVAVDTAGDVWVAEEGSEAGENHGPIQEFDNSLVNIHVTELSPGFLRSPGIAVDAEQNLYLFKGGADAVKFNNIGETLIEAMTACGCGKALAFDTSASKLLFDEGNAIAVYSPNANVATETETEHETIAGLSASYGVTVNGASVTHDLYASQREADTVAIFKLVLLPDVTTGAASEVHRTTAKLAGEVNPDGQAVTSCGFEYGPTEAYGHTVACSSSPGSGSSFVPVSAEATGLSFQSAYHFRLIAGNTNGTHPGKDQTFTTPPAVEGVVTGAASEVLGTSAKLAGSFEPNGFDTHYLFEYGPAGAPAFSTALEDAGSATENKQVTAVVSGLEPNQSYQFLVLAENTFGQTIGSQEAFTTAVIAPLVPGTPSASFIAAQSAVLTAKVNPEHTTTHYHFQYGACPALNGCATVQSTPDETSTVFGETGSTQEIVGLAPATTYTYRLIAVNEFEATGELRHETTTGAEATFTTAAAVIPGAQTGGYTILGATSAVISGTVEPHGVPTSYSFELGIYNGASTQYGTLATGTAGAGEAPLPVSETLTGLQPGATYAYRLSISSGYITTNEAHTLQAAPATFTTPGLPSVLTNPPLLPQLPIPNVAFPTETKGSTTTTKTLTNKQKLTKALKACKRDKNKGKRQQCEKAARKKFGPVKKAKKGGKIVNTNVKGKRKHG